MRSLYHWIQHYIAGPSPRSLYHWIHLQHYNCWAITAIALSLDTFTTLQMLGHHRDRSIIGYIYNTTIAGPSPRSLYHLIHLQHYNCWAITAIALSLYTFTTLHCWAITAIALSLDTFTTLQLLGHHRDRSIIGYIYNTTIAGPSPRSLYHWIHLQHYNCWAITAIALSLDQFTTLQLLGHHRDRSIIIYIYNTTLLGHHRDRSIIGYIYNTTIAGPSPRSLYHYIHLQHYNCWAITAIALSLNTFTTLQLLGHHRDRSIIIYIYNTTIAGPSPRSLYHWIHLQHYNCWAITAIALSLDTFTTLQLLGHHRDRSIIEYIYNTTNAGPSLRSLYHLIHLQHYNCWAITAIALSLYTFTTLHCWAITAIALSLYTFTTLQMLGHHRDRSIIEYIYNTTNAGPSPRSLYHLIHLQHYKCWAITAIALSLNTFTTLQMLGHHRDRSIIIYIYKTTLLGHHRDRSINIYIYNTTIAGPSPRSLHHWIHLQHYNCWAITAIALSLDTFTTLQMLGHHRDRSIIGYIYNTTIAGPSPRSLYHYIHLQHYNCWAITAIALSLYTFTTLQLLGHHRDRSIIEYIYNTTIAGPSPRSLYHYIHLQHYKCWAITTIALSLDTFTTLHCWAITAIALSLDTFTTLHCWAITAIALSLYTFTTLHCWAITAIALSLYTFTTLHCWAITAIALSLNTFTTLQLLGHHRDRSVIIYIYNTTIAGPSPRSLYHWIHLQHYNCWAITAIALSLYTLTTLQLLGHHRDRSIIEYIYNTTITRPSPRSLYHYIHLQHYNCWAITAIALSLNTFTTLQLLGHHRDRSIIIYIYNTTIAGPSPRSLYHYIHLQHYNCWAITAIALSLNTFTTLQLLGHHRDRSIIIYIYNTTNAGPSPRSLYHWIHLQHYIAVPSPRSLYHWIHLQHYIAGPSPRSLYHWIHLQHYIAGPSPRSLYHYIHLQHYIAGPSPRSLYHWIHLQHYKCWAITAIALSLDTFTTLHCWAITAIALSLDTFTTLHCWAITAIALSLYKFTTLQLLGHHRDRSIIGYIYNTTLLGHHRDRSIIEYIYNTTIAGPSPRSLYHWIHLQHYKCWAITAIALSLDTFTTPHCWAITAIALSLDTFTTLHCWAITAIALSLYTFTTLQLLGHHRDRSIIEYIYNTTIAGPSPRSLYHWIHLQHYNCWAITAIALSLNTFTTLQLLGHHRDRSIIIYIYNTTIAGPSPRSLYHWIHLQHYNCWAITVIALSLDTFTTLHCWAITAIALSLDTFTPLQMLGHHRDRSIIEYIYNTTNAGPSPRSLYH